MTQNLNTQSNNLITQDYQFTQTWFLNVCQYWPELFSRLGWNSKEPKMILEIGCFEGQATCWMLENLIDNENSQIFCLDIFEVPEEEQTGQYKYDLKDLFQRFIHNVSVTGKEDLVQVLVGDSKYNLSQLVSHELSFDFIYVDGSHDAKDVLADAILGWMLLKKGGLMIFDDYLWEFFEQDIVSAPKMGIDSFINCYSREIRIIRTPQNYQVCLLKK
ncbi:class I SAM-dependent methyltransferase [Crocosphaera subtropica]|nr:class I SAM-dependent methyltransferase [Crocosphaera subtropica]